MVSLSRATAALSEKAKRVSTKKTEHRGRPKAERLEIDVEWMKARMSALGFKSWAELSRKLGIDKAMMSKSLTGDRAFGVREVALLANALQVSTDEVMRRIGYEVDRRGIAISGKITEDAKVSPVTHRKGEIFTAENAPSGAVALVVEGIPGYAGAIFIYSPVTEAKPVPLTLLGQLCVIEADNHLTAFVGTLVKGSTRHKLMLELVHGSGKIEVENVHSAAPIHAIYFP